MKTNANINPRKRKFIFLGLGVSVLAIGGLSYWYFFGRKPKPEDPEEEFNLPDVKTTTNPAKPSAKPKVTPAITVPATNNYSAPPSPNEFPLKDKSRGQLVKNVQNALMQKFGKSILPASGADGIFGKGLAKALAAKGFPVVIDEVTYNKIITLNNPIATPAPTKGISATDKDNIDIVKNIWLNCTIKKLDPLLEQLKRITSVAHYVKLNELFKTIRLNGVRQTIVNAALSTFSDSTSKQFISEALKKIGLKYYDDKWNLSGLTDRQIITNQETTICGINGCTQKVPGQTVLGVELTRGKFKTRFRSLNNQTLYVPTNHIDYV